MENVVIFGASDQAKMVASVFAAMERYTVVGMIAPSGSPSSIDGLDIIGSEEDLSNLADRVRHGIVAVGDNHTRQSIVNKITTLAPDFSFVSAIHPTAIIDASVQVGGGTFIGPGVILNPGTIVGEHCILNTGSIIEHDNRVDDFATISPGVTTGGNVSVGKGAVLGLGCSVLQGRQVGEHTVVGAGAVVTKNIEANSVSMGVPARFVRTRSANDPYLS